MRIFSKGVLRDFWKENPTAEKPLRSWYKEAEKATWQNFAEIKKLYRSADIVKNKVVFNIGGNKFRLIVKLDYQKQLVLIKFIGTHKEYNQINVEEL